MKTTFQLNFFKFQFKSWGTFFVLWKKKPNELDGHSFEIFRPKV